MKTRNARNLGKVIIKRTSIMSSGMYYHDKLNERLFHPRKKIGGATHTGHMAAKRSLSVKFEEKSSPEDRDANQESRTGGNWCEAVSSLSNVNARQAWKSGTEKLTQTFNNFKTTFGVLSQRIKKSTKRRQPLINVESPVTPYTRSRAALGRTPTKLYSPFSIDSPAGKENITNRFIKDEVNLSIKGGKKKPRRTKLDLGITENSSSIGKEISSNDLLQTQIGIYEFQSIANRIVQNGSNN